MTPGGLRTHDHSRQAAADLGLRLRSHCDRLMMCTADPILSDTIVKKEMGGECSAYGGEKRRIQGFGGET